MTIVPFVGIDGTSASHGCHGTGAVVGRMGTIILEALVALGVGNRGRGQHRHARDW